MSKKTKYIKYYLNGKEVKKEIVAARKGKTLESIDTIVKKYYEAPLSEKEKEEKQKEAINSMKAWSSLREAREDLEARHG